MNLEIKFDKPAVSVVTHSVPPIQESLLMCMVQHLWNVLAHGKAAPPVVPWRTTHCATVVSEETALGS